MENARSGVGPKTKGGKRRATGGRVDGKASGKVE
jgi:hypothetical protein